jgi:hypothetical protein
LVLSAIVCRAAIEGDAGNPEAEEFAVNVRKWVHDIGIAEEAEAEEIVVLGLKLGGLSSRQRIDCSWRAEGLVVLAWALGKCELPTYDVGADPYPISRVLGFRESRAESALAFPILRSAEEINDVADRLLSLHWRLRQYSLDKKPMNFEEFARTAYFGPLSLDGLRLVSHDIEIRGVPLCDASESVWREVLSITRERQQAANWLTGEESIYSEVTCDT